MRQGDSSYAQLGHLNWIDETYERYLADPMSVEPSWRHFFEGVSFGTQIGIDPTESPDLRIHLLIEAYRVYGHLLAKINPIETGVIQEVAELSLEKLGFSTSELKQPFPTCGFLKEPQAPLEAMIEALRKTYCRSIGVEYMDLGQPQMEEWIQQRIEPFFPVEFTREQKLRILDFLNRSELFESFIHTRYVGQKRFSLEGGETLIPMLGSLLEVGAESGVKEAVIGMSHRGRLNVLVNILNKSYSQVFHQFEDHYSPDLFEGTGDVKYHHGYSGALSFPNGKKVEVTLAANPSHLESVDPVVEGEARAKQELIQDPHGVVPILIHGDAAVAGQGVVYETLQLSRLKGYGTGGTLHIVVNNQIGFTTLPKDGRSTRYCTDVAKAFGAPVFHVNAEDPEGCVAVAKLAIQIRQRFGCDVFIDLNCYRKYGHNESDEPTFTQPLEYTLIKSKRPIRQILREKLVQEGVLTSEEADKMEEEFKANLQKGLDSIPKTTESAPPPARPTPAPAKTAVSQERLIALAERFCFIPESIKVHPKIAKLQQERLAMLKGGIDWGMGEHLAFASLLTQKIHIRISGQDSRRGTFSHRHAVWVDQVKELRYFPLSHLAPDQAVFDVYNSPLSEFAVLGFDFGYSLMYPSSLVIWEAQFGDFANGAQVMIDQYLAASEQKWSHRSNILLMLPHGYEGQGPEHSSARIERFLQLAGEENMRIANCTTPAQLFHLIRHQGLDEEKRPLILFTPKALLRHPQCLSPLADFTAGNFQQVLDDPTSPTSATKLLLCSGKVFYDLIAEREKRKVNHVAILRIEQLYPFPKEMLAALVQKYPGVKECVWVQEEHRNMGAWDYIGPLIGRGVSYCGRERSASTAAGSYALHKKQYEAFMNQAFTEAK